MWRICHTNIAIRDGFEFLQNVFFVGCGLVWRSLKDIDPRFDME